MRKRQPAIVAVAPPHRPSYWPARTSSLWPTRGSAVPGHNTSLPPCETEDVMVRRDDVGVAALHVQVVCRATCWPRTGACSGTTSQRD